MALILPRDIPFETQKFNYDNNITLIKLMLIDLVMFIFGKLSIITSCVLMPISIEEVK